MKKAALLFLFCALLSCKNDDDNLNDNPYLTQPLISLDLNLNLPQYDALNFPSSTVVITSQGIRGIIVYNVNNSQYLAWELSDPNHIPNDCSAMEVEFPFAECTCDDDNRYDITTGQHVDNPDLYPMQFYRAERVGNIVRITN
ncbi:Rieske (2Fe-2S) protein [Luteirhabdus pelagi]|uniref:hypothetical protein n=1 Tax=Luteirhabdus pelagi TaxID=2792783 RepID=UPI00193A6FB0|nr:hypothetical protein [Luteirhabdus pelagi]